MEQNKPFLSIIVPTFNRRDKLADCLESLSHLDYPQGRVEVVVVDDGSQVTPESVVSRFLDRLDVTLLTQAHAGPAAARNNGATKARGEFLVFTDDDCSPAPDWLQKLSARFFDFPDHAIGGRTINGLPSNLYSVASQAIIDVVYAYYNTNPNQTCFFASNNLAMPADRFHAIGGFDVTFMTSEDRELCDRWRHYGFQMTYAPEVLVYHAHALTFYAFWQRYFNYGRGAFRFHQAVAKRGSGCFRVDHKFYLNLFRYPFSQEQGQRVLLFTVLLVMSQIANAMGFFGEWLRQPIKKNSYKPLVC
jgi:glycosyltransferase involved in cell wall biosynthesis